MRRYIEGGNIKWGRFFLKTHRLVLLVTALAITASGCTSVGTSSDGQRQLSDASSVSPSYLKVASSQLNEDDKSESQTLSASMPSRLTPAGNKIQKLEALEWPSGADVLRSELDKTLKEGDQTGVSAEDMPLESFIHYTLGELLGLNYILDSSFGSEEAESSSSVTLSIKDPVSSRQLFDLVSTVLMERGYSIKFVSGTYFVLDNEGASSASQLSIGFGRDESSVPNTALDILQIIPLKFGIKVSIERTLRELTKAKITPDFSQSVIFVQGDRQEILRAIEFIDLLDTPSMRGKHIGLIELKYLTPDGFSSQIKDLLANEGVDISIGTPGDRNVVLVGLSQLGSVAVFATEEFLLKRVKYWASVIDVIGEGPTKRFFVYKPKFSRALDLEKSLSGLLGLQQSGGKADSDGGSLSTGNAPSSYRGGSGGQGDLSIVVDENANALIFYTSGNQYRDLQELLQKIDVMPLQVMLDITVAEVSLKDEFKHGVEWAVARGEVNLTTQGAFGATSIGGIGLVINGSEGPLQANMLSTNSLVKILSRPTLMARDGVSASISVGSQVSVVGQTTQDPINGDRQTTTSTYRQTGISISVTPTVNDSGTVALQIQQNISNSVPGSVGAGGNPDIFERSISTEVVARSGQTVLLGGLISENGSNSEAGTPALSKIPVLGNLFKSKTKQSDRTELIMLVTPKVIKNVSDWDVLIDDFESGLRSIDIQ